MIDLVFLEEQKEVRIGILNAETAWSFIVQNNLKIISVKNFTDILKVVVGV